MKKYELSILIRVLITIFVFVNNCAGLPLSSRSQWIVDDASGGRVKLACANWAAHLRPMLAEGLDKRPLPEIVATIVAWGFNCVRLTWATAMFTDPVLANRTVNETFTRLKLQNAIDGISAHNPAFLNMTTVAALRAVAAELGRQGVMVVLDNQMSHPGWCCAEGDGNGFWGDANFNVGDWRRGLKAVAAEFRDNPYVVAMSLRNELRGKRQNVNDWYKYVQMGAKAIHAANADLLIIYGGLSYAQNLKFLQNHPLQEIPGIANNKIVYEIHRYAFTNGKKFNRDGACTAAVAGMRDGAGFLTAPDQPYTAPLFVSEFGVNVQKWGRVAADVRFIDCMAAFLEEGDLDWAVWALQGSYYMKKSAVDSDEVFGLLDHQWENARNASFPRRIQALQQPISAATAAQLPTSASAAVSPMNSVFPAPLLFSVLMCFLL